MMLGARRLGGLARQVEDSAGSPDSTIRPALLYIH